MDFIKNPRAIEEKSMDLIDPFISDIELTSEEITVYSRMIHASGDVDYGHLIATSKGAVAAGIDALAKGCNIYTDVNMVKAGINKNALSVLGRGVLPRIRSGNRKIAKEKYSPLHGCNEFFWSRSKRLNYRSGECTDGSV